MPNSPSSKLIVHDVAAPDGLKDDIERWLKQHFPKPP
jgi:hypothetical protein